MKKYRDVCLYTLLFCSLLGLILFILQKGLLLESVKTTADFTKESSDKIHFLNFNIIYVVHPLATLLLQITTIIFTTRLFNYILKKIKQPLVISEIVAGIFLGPSFLGLYFPELFSFIFPQNSLGNLDLISHLGLIFFLFIVGMNLNTDLLKKKLKEAIVVSYASIILPFTLGISFAYFIYQEFAPTNVRFISFALFVGVAMSITAFPVLARIVQERGLAKTKLGTIAITCAAIDDISAWCLLAIAVATVNFESMLGSMLTIGLSIVYIFTMLRFVKPFLKKVGDTYSSKEGMSKPIVAIFFITLLLSSYCTELIGIHSLFGAFMAGIVMPDKRSFKNIFIEKIEDVSYIILMPLFFVSIGLRTQIGLINDFYLWNIMLLITSIAIVGKFAGSGLSAKLSGETWKDSFAIGALINTRGLMELVVLKIGLDLGILDNRIFAMFVIMSLITTFMTNPILDLINKLTDSKSRLADNISNALKYNILVSFGDPLKGVSLLKLANCFIRKTMNNASITILHISPNDDLGQHNQDEYEEDSFYELKKEASRLDLPIVTLFKSSEYVEQEIIQTANIGNFDLLLIGIGNSIWGGTLLGKILDFTTKIINPGNLYDKLTGREKLFESYELDDRIKRILKQSNISVGILIDKHLGNIETAFIPVYFEEDIVLLEYARKLIHNNQTRITILDLASKINQNSLFCEAIRAIEQVQPNHITVYNKQLIDSNFLSRQDLMLIGLTSWKSLITKKETWLSETPSVLIIKSSN